MSKADVILISASNDETVQQRRLRLAPLRTAADMLVVSAAGVLLFAWFRRLQSGDSLSEIIASHGLIPAAVVTQAAAFVVIGELALAIGALWLVCVQRRTRVAACWLGGTAAGINPCDAMISDKESPDCSRLNQANSRTPAALTTSMS
ncbi:MAG: hypothetical protein AAFY46_10010, partial [Planctomycetota bacterium]